MVRIIERGQIPNNRLIVTKCKHCQTRFDFRPNEAARIPDQREGDYLKIACPLCKADCTVAC
jgi:hypothetical protein